MPGISEIPLVRVFIPFLAGIVSSVTFHFSVPPTLFFLLSVLIIGILFYLVIERSINYDMRWVFGFVVIIFFFLAGNILTSSNNQLNDPNHYSNYIDDDGYVILELIEPVSERQNSYRITARVTKVITSAHVFSTKGKVILYTAKDSIARMLKYGDEIITVNRFSDIAPPPNPQQFNYKRYLSLNNIHYQGYRSPGQYKLIGSDGGNIIKSTALGFRQKALEALNKYGLADQKHAVVSALLLGYREYLDDDITRAFAGAGAMHILCVSGLHVGIIYIIFNSLLSFLNKTRYGKIYKTIMIVLLIWSYAAITGFSPSVLRASTMFSFIALAKSSNRNTNIYNVLAASAFLLTMINPYIVSKIGFQLSYLAVIGIVSLQPCMYKSLYFKNMILDKAWAIITVSIAAQLATGPLVVYYFNQFPNYFIITNLAVIPLTTLIIYSSLIFLFFSSFTIIAGFFSEILSFLVFLLYRSVQFVEGLPYSTMSNVNIGITEVFILLFLVVSIPGFIIRRSKLCFFISLPLILLLTSSSSIKYIEHNKQNAFVVYSINNHSAIDFVSGRDCIFIADHELYDSGKQTIDYNIVQNRINLGVDNVNTIVVNDEEKTGNEPVSFPFLWRKNNYFLFNDIKVKVIDRFESYDNDADFIPIVLDYLILSNDPAVEVSELKRFYDFRKLIIDSSNSFWNTKRWVDQCEKLKVDYWSTYHKGAYLRHL